MAVYERITGIKLAPIMYEYSADYNVTENAEWLTSWLLTLCDAIPLSEAKAGDIITYRMKEGATINHCAFKAGKSTIIHRYWGRPVSESFSAPYWDKRAVFAFRFKSVSPANNPAPALEIVA